MTDCSCQKKGDCVPASGSDSGTAPDLDRTGDEYVLVDDSAKVELTASGGSSAEPSDGCGPFTMGATKYKFTYSELTGSPASGAESDSATLTLDRDPDGYADVIVEISQEWIDANGKTTHNTSPASPATPVKVQTPTKTTETGRSVDSVLGPNLTLIPVIKYKHVVEDQKGNAVKPGNETLDVLESLHGEASGTLTWTPPGTTTPTSAFLPTKTWDYTDEQLDDSKLKPDGTFEDPIGATGASFATDSEVRLGTTLPNGAIGTVTVRTTNHTYKIRRQGQPDAALDGAFNRTVKIHVKKENGGWKVDSVEDGDPPTNQ